MRAREPETSGYVVRSGVRIYYEVFGDGPTTLLLLPPWAIVDSRVWKMQAPYLARHFRVVTFDPRGNGRSDRPAGPEAYADTETVADALAVLDATGSRTVVGVGLSKGAAYLLRLAAEHPERLRGAVFVGPNVGLAGAPGRRAVRFDETFADPAGWQKFNADYWRRDQEGFARFFFGEMFPEPHSTKAIEDGLAWALQTDPETLIATQRAPLLAGAPRAEDGRRPAARLAERVRCPCLVVTGDDDRIVGSGSGTALADALGCRLEVLAGAGHGPNVRHPVRFNVLLRDFVRGLEAPSPSAPPRTPWLFARQRPRRALWVCSPIGLGHVLRDLAIARALRQRVPELQIEWWAQPPVTAVLEAEGEIVHPASAELASESAHWEGEARAHELPAFDAFRRLDEIFCANYLLFDDVVRESPYDLWVGDESWEVDHFLHENPERKIAPYAFLTDVVGFLPVEPGEAELCADYNAELIEHRERFPYLRDRSIFIGGFDELPPASFGAGLPEIREWSRRWFTSVPYVVPFDPRGYRSTAALRRRLGYGTGYPLYVAAVGGTAVGRRLLELTAEAFALVRKEQPDARMVLVAGPRLHPADLPDVEGMDKVGYVPALFEHLACADVAVVQGGLSTTMELVAARRPFVYFPLARHWEQQQFVTHRLDHYRAGRRMDYDCCTPVDLAAAMIAAREGRPAYRSVPRDGADRTAALLASVLCG